MRIEGCDILVGIFWKRFGTPVHDADSGTEHEILTAWKAWEKSGRPRIMIYFKQKSYLLDTEEEADQLKKLLHFKQALPRKVYWWSFKNISDFKDSLRSHLSKYACPFGKRA